MRDNMKARKTHIKKGGWTPETRKAVAILDAVNKAKSERASMTPDQLKRRDKQVHRSLAKHYHTEFVDALASVPSNSLLQTAKCIEAAMNIISHETSSLWFKLGNQLIAEQA